MVETSLGAQYLKAALSKWRKAHPWANHIPWEQIPWRYRNGIEYVPPSVVEGLARITQAQDDHRLLLTAKSAALSQPLSVSPTIPLHTTAAEGTKTPASFDSAPRLASSTAIESCTAAIPNDRTAKLERIQR